MASPGQNSNESLDSNQEVQDHVEPSNPVGESNNMKVKIQTLKSQDFVEEFVGEDLGLDVRPTVIKVHPPFLRPFEEGITREVVIRKFKTSLETSQIDIYYHTPQRHPKLRSLPDVKLYLAKYPEVKLKVENFCFTRNLLGIKNSNYEVIRRVRPNRKSDQSE